VQLESPARINLDRRTGMQQSQALPPAGTRERMEDTMSA
jgi:hypothetical protein